MKLGPFLECVGHVGPVDSRLRLGGDALLPELRGFAKLCRLRILFLHSLAVSRPLCFVPRMTGTQASNL